MPLKNVITCIAAPTTAFRPLTRLGTMLLHVAMDLRRLLCDDTSTSTARDIAGWSVVHFKFVIQKINDAF